MALKLRAVRLQPGQHMRPAGREVGRVHAPVRSRAPLHRRVGPALGVEGALLLRRPPSGPPVRVPARSARAARARPDGRPAAEPLPPLAMGETAAGSAPPGVGLGRGAHGPAPRDVRAVRAPAVLPLGQRRCLPRRAALLRPRHRRVRGVQLERRLPRPGSGKAAAAARLHAPGVRARRRGERGRERAVLAGVRVVAAPQGSERAERRLLRALAAAVGGAGRAQRERDGLHTKLHLRRGRNGAHPRERRREARGGQVHRIDSRPGGARLLGVVDVCARLTALLGAGPRHCPGLRLSTLSDPSLQAGTGNRSRTSRRRWRTSCRRCRGATAPSTSTSVGCASCPPRSSPRTCGSASTTAARQCMPPARCTPSACCTRSATSSESSSLSSGTKISWRWTRPRRCGSSPASPASISTAARRPGREATASPRGCARASEAKARRTPSRTPTRRPRRTRRRCSPRRHRTWRPSSRHTTRYCASCCTLASRGLRATTARCRSALRPRRGWPRSGTSAAWRCAGSR
mmetsp:Transcript_4328/g.13979  ORF Transcript_4328/g.13979 Transcript_4328/m.13979 type:complete len:519 (+) Transcript_4328:410-1966(+)